MEVKFKLRIDQDPEVFDRVSPGNVLVREIIWCVTRVQTSSRMLHFECEMVICQVVAQDLIKLRCCWKFVTAFGEERLVYI